MLLHPEAWCRTAGIPNQGYMHPKVVVKQVPGGTWNDFALLNQ